MAGLSPPYELDVPENNGKAFKAGSRRPPG